MKKKIENEEKEQSKMSLAARKAWETRRKRSGIKPREKKEKGKKSGAESGAEVDVVVEQLSRAYRKGVLERKGKRGHGKSSVRMTDEMQMFLYGSRWLSDIVIEKLRRDIERLAKAVVFREKEVAAGALEDWQALAPRGLARPGK